MKTASERDAQLAEVLEEYLEALEAGTAPPRADFVARHPELAEQLEACLASLDFIRRAGAAPASHSSAPAARDKDSGTPLPARTLALAVPPSGEKGDDATPREGGATKVLAEPLHLGAYRIVREIGRGGMGIVYEAEQASGAHVALKVLPFAAALDPRQLQRFKNEAEAASRLRHPNIVPVFAVGSERDVHYYAMKYVEGKTLARMIADLRLGIADLPANTGASGKSAIRNLQSAISQMPFFHTVAQYGIQAAEALEQAHQVGIIHRDIKPANLLVEPNGHLWVADFGLALFQHDAAGLTLTGDLVGTLRYMSPEQALGKHGIVDQRADIYSLGVTLYELVTLQPAFLGSERRDLLRQIAFEEPRPPRRINKAIPLELETILLKATAKEPSARYATAQEFADDLRRFVAGQLIAARRPGLLDRASRWARRHKSLVAGAAAVALVGVVALAVSSIFIVRARDEAERRAQEARQAVDEMYTQVAQKWWFQQPHMEPVQREFLLKALAFYEKFSREHGDTADLRLDTARAARRVGDIQHRLGEQAKAEAAYDGAIAKLAELAAKYPTEPAYRDELANTHNNRGNLLRDQGRRFTPLREFRLAHELFAALVQENPQQPDYRDGLAGSLSNVGMMLYTLGSHQEAEKAYRESLDILAGLTRDYADVPAYQHSLAGCRANLASLLRDTNRPREAKLAYEQALAGWQKLSAQLPGMPHFRQCQADSHSGLAIVYAGLGRNREAEAAHRKALALRERLANEYPGVLAYWQALAASRHSLGRLLADMGRAKEAGTFFDQALTLRKSLAGDRPELSVHREELADTFQGMASLLASAGQPFGAERALRDALTLRQKLVREDKNEGSSTRAALLWDLGRCLHELGTVQQRLGHLDEGEPNYRAAIIHADKLVSAFPRVPAYGLELAAVRNDLATLYQRTDRFAEAEKLHRAALELRAKLAADFRDAPYYQAELAVGHINLGSVFRDTGRPVEAEAAYRQASAIAQKLTREFPSLPEYRRLLCVAQQQLGELLLATGRLPEAEQALRQARPLVDKLAAEFPELPLYREHLARHLHALGLVLARSARPVEAEEAFQQELLLRDKLAAEFTEDVGLARDVAYLLANCPDTKLRQPRRAVEMAKAAADKSPKDAATLSVLGIAHYRAGAWKEAIALLEKAEKLPGKHQGGPFVLAMAHWQQGDKEKARACYRRASVWMEQHSCDAELWSLEAEAKMMLKASP